MIVSDENRKLIALVLQHALKEKYIEERSPNADFISRDAIKSQVQSLKQAFPSDNTSSWLHAFAIKATPLAGVLDILRKEGLGAEVASWPEVVHALQLGFSPSKVVFDSPCKTKRDLQQALEAGIILNLDNLCEIRKVQELLQDQAVNELDIETLSNQERVGLRINPNVGAGRISVTSTATKTSKFGVLLTDQNWGDVLQVFLDNPWIRGLHMHVGSQGCEMSMLVRAAEILVSFAEEINEKRGQCQIKFIDLGGGLSTSYTDDTPSDYGAYSRALADAVPQLFNGSFRVITEFGRSLMAKCGFTASLVEAVKDCGGQRTAIIHVGANYFVRPSYLPAQWSHRISVYSQSGVPKQDNAVSQSVAGPLCFSGDYIAKERSLPKIEEGDILVIHDTSTYSLSMYSHYNSRVAGPVYLYEFFSGFEISSNAHDPEETPTPQKKKTRLSKKDVDEEKRSDDPQRICFHKIRQTCSIEQTLQFWGGC